MKKPKLTEVFRIKEDDDVKKNRLDTIRGRAMKLGVAGNDSDDPDDPTAGSPDSYSPLQKQRIQNGQCKDCGKARSGKSKVYCDDCLRRHNTYGAKSRGDRRPGICATCGKKTGDMTTRCKACWNRYGIDNKKTDKQKFDAERSTIGLKKPEGPQ